MKDEVLFENWLTNYKGYSKESSRDVISRIKRVNKIIILPSKIDLYTIFKLGQSEEFNKLSPSVKSQLRRAIRLLKEYQET